MEAKEKAQELFKKYYCIDNSSKTKIKVIEFETAKRCALIAVDEIIKLLPNINLTPPNNREEDNHYSQYWVSVKNELEKL